MCNSLLIIKTIPDLMMLYHAALFSPTKFTWIEKIVQNLAKYDIRKHESVPHRITFTTNKLNTIKKTRYGIKKIAKTN